MPAAGGREKRNATDRLFPAACYGAGSRVT